MKPHIHAEVIKAWANGADIECKNPGTGKWVPCPGPSWQDHGQYRIKEYPQSTMTVKEMEYAYLLAGGVNSWNSGAAKSLADAAIRHALMTGLVIFPKDGTS